MRDIKARQVSFDKAKAAENILNETGVGPASNLYGNLVNSFNVGKDEHTGDLLSSPERTALVKEQTKVFTETLQNDSVNIWNRPPTEDEENLSIPEVQRNRKNEIIQLRMDRLVEFESDMRTQLIKLHESQPDFDYANLKTMRTVQADNRAAIRASKEYEEAPSWMGVGKATRRDIQKAIIERELSEPIWTGGFGRSQNPAQVAAYAHSWTSIEKAERVLTNGTNPVELQELRSKKYSGFIPLDARDLNWTNDALVGMDLIEASLRDEEGAINTIKEYMTELELDPDDPNAREEFISSQIIILQEDFGVSPNIDIEEAIKTVKE
jgi:hypothetical protein